MVYLMRLCEAWERAFFYLLKHCIRRYRDNVNKTDNNIGSQMMFSLCKLVSNIAEKNLGLNFHQFRQIHHSNQPNQGKEQTASKMAIAELLTTVKSYPIIYDSIIQYIEHRIVPTVVGRQNVKFYALLILSKSHPFYPSSQPLTFHVEEKGPLICTQSRHLLSIATCYEEAQGITMYQ